ncbi:MAG: ABC transporter substrate-binding protein [Thainema sp.]
MSLLLFTACRSTQTTNQTTNTPEPSPVTAITLTDASGTAITLPRAAERIVCLHLSCIDILAELGIVPLAVGHPRLADWAKSPIYFGEAANQIAVVGGPEPNLERLLALQPDVVIGYRGQIDGLRETLAPIAPLVLLEVNTVEQAISNLRQLGQLTNRSETAETAIQAFQDRLADYQTQARPDQTVLVTNSIQDTFYVATRESLVGATLVELVDYPWSLGDRNPSAINWAVFSTEIILQVNPEVVFVLVDRPQGLDSLTQDPVWSKLRAVQQGRVYELPDAKVGGLTTGTRSLNHLLNAIMTRLNAIQPIN